MQNKATPRFLARAMGFDLTLGPTKGERRLFLAYANNAFFGFCFGLFVIMHLDSDAVFSRGLTLWEGWVVFSGVIGAVLALRLSRDRFGRAGQAFPVAGSLLVTAIGPIIAGSLALPGYGTMFGPFSVGVIFFAAPITLALWIGNLYSTHMLLRAWHAERESIFGAPQPLMPRAVVEWWQTLRSEGI